MMKKIILFAAMLCISAGLFAHALWIETNPVGQKGKSQQVKVFYGEYADGKPDKVADWYSNMKEFTLWLVTADNQKIQLPVTAAEDHFLATFTPAGDGLYCLQVSHEPKDLGRATKYQFNASATVKVGKANDNISGNHNPLKFSLKGNAVKQPVTVQGFFNDAASSTMSVTVFSPAGWTKELSGNEAGEATFVPEWPGKYMIEISRTDDEKGDHGGKPYEKVWRCATYLVEIKK